MRAANLAPMRRDTTPHILNTSSNLLGFCLIVMTSLRLSDKAETTFLDELTGAASVLLMASCALSFLSMRSRNEARSERLENKADIVFIAALTLVFATIVLVAFHFMA